LDRHQVLKNPDLAVIEQVDRETRQFAAALLS